MSTSKIKQLRADNIALMTVATTCVQYARGTRFSLKMLYDLARLEEKEARCLVDKEFAHISTLANAKDAATMMSSITDSNGYTTVSCHGGSPLHPFPGPIPNQKARKATGRILLRIGFSPRSSHPWQTAQPRCGSLLMQCRIGSWESPPAE